MAFGLFSKPAIRESGVPVLSTATGVEPVVSMDIALILAASIRSANHIIQAAQAGAHVCTCPLEPILGLLKHPLTDIGLAKFLEDAKKM